MTTLQSQPAPLAPADSKSRPLLEIADFALSFLGGDGVATKAVDGVSLTVHPRQTLAVVGESGCGKSVTALSVLRLIPRPPGRIDRGSIVLDGVGDLLRLTEKQMLPVRGREVAMIFQEPMTCLNPVFTIGEQIIEAILLHQDVKRTHAVQFALEAMNEVGIPRPAERLRAYPHQFSGGMRQRVMIAMALACRPRLLLADEPTTALDVTIQAQILDLLATLQRQRGMGIMLITHDLGVVAQNADVVCVMYAGRVVEYARAPVLFERPLHPYTRGLLRCRPKLNQRTPRLETIAQIMSDSKETAGFPGHDAQMIPWWPHRIDDATSSGPFKDGSGGQYVLHQIEAEHWVAGVSKNELPPMPWHAPDIDFRRGI